MDSTHFNLRRQLKAWRTAKGISQKDLGERAGLGQTAIGNYEGLATPRNVGISTLQSIAEVLGIDLKTLMFELPSSYVVSEPYVRYAVELPSGSPLHDKVSRFVMKLNRALQQGLDEKFIDILEHLLAREVKMGPHG